MKQYKNINDALGWIVFLVAAFTYCSTIEPTASFWDCPEFIATASRLEVGHPPGAPFFMLFGNFFALFASDASQIAKMVNIMSALLSAGCILFLFWSITHLAKRLIVKDGVAPTMEQTIAIMASGVSGALIYTWSDTFWFSAVEGEVYAFSSFFTAIVFWLILKWEDNAEKPGSDKWLVFIAYLVGLSIGVHLLNLLCIPAIVLVVYYRLAKRPDGTGSLIVLALSAVLVAAVLYGVVPGIVKVGGEFELLFVNDWGFSYNTGLYVYITLLALSLIWALWETHRAAADKNIGRTRMYISFLVATALLGIPFYGHGTMSLVLGVIILGALAAVLFMSDKATPRILNTAVLCMTVMTIGYSSYAVIVIRSTANPPMDQNSPEDIFTLGEYLGREQYGERPLFYGQTFNSKRNVVEENGDLVYERTKGAPVYQRVDKADPNQPDEYKVIRTKDSYTYPSDQCMFFPRIYSEDHAPLYKDWLGDVSYRDVDYQYTQGGKVSIPTQKANMQFFLGYQCNWMYMRYFMWNFAGRQNDLQGGGGPDKGNWLTGFSVIDDARLGNQSALPSDLKNNKGHNVFFCLPLILGLIGFFWQALAKGDRGIQQFWVVFFLFVMTGIAIVVYLNQTPNQPRERDYAYAGSFYAFAIWCGLGITAIYDFLERLAQSKRIPALAVSALCCVPALAVPLQMVSQTWDDHDRSDRFVCRDFGRNYLETIPHNGIIFTNGDNDTFPLWYNEDVEGQRTDVRVCNLSYLQTDWYIDQMKRPAFAGEGQSSPLPITWNRLQYTSGKNEITTVEPKIGDIIRKTMETDSTLAEHLWGGDPFELKNAIKYFVLKDYSGINLDPREQEIVEHLVNEWPSCLPTDTFHITVDKDAVRRSGMKLFVCSKEGIVASDIVSTDSLGNTTVIPAAEVLESMGLEVAEDSIPDQMIVTIKDADGNTMPYVTKSYMMMLEMLAQSNFSRPMYMSTTVGDSNYGILYRHFLQEGIAWRFTPYTFLDNDPLHTVVDTEKMYDNMMNKYNYGNLKQPDLYIDETTMRMCFTHRRWFANLITNLVKEGKKDMALKALEKCDTEIPSCNVPHDMGCGSLDIANAYIECGKPEKAAEILQRLEKKSTEYIDWYLSLSSLYFQRQYRQCFSELYTLGTLLDVYKRMSKKEGDEFAMKAEDIDQLIYGLEVAFQHKCASSGVDLSKVL